MNLVCKLRKRAALTMQAARELSRSLSCRYEMHHGVKITDEALVDAAVESDRYIADRFLPDKVCDPEPNLHSDPKPSFLPQSIFQP